MSVRVRREDFLHVLESIQPGLTPKDTVDQSSSFIFDAGSLVTYNDEVCCRVKSPLGEEFQGAVNAKKLLDYLSRLPEDEIYAESEGARLLVRTDRKRKAHFGAEAEIFSKYGKGVDVPDPGGWKRLPKEFCEAVAQVQECARVSGDFNATMVHVHPEWVEASDGFELCRWNLKTRFSKEVLLRKEHFRHITSLAMAEFAETKNWVHFRNGDGLEIAFRRYDEPYDDYTPYLKSTGTPTTIPKGFVDEADIGRLFAESKDPHVEIEMRPGKTRLTASNGIDLYESPWRKVSYEGPPFSFLISPKMLSSIADKHNECILGERLLYVVADKWTYVAYLTAPKKEPAPEERNGDAASQAPATVGEGRRAEIPF